MESKKIVEIAPRIDGTFLMARTSRELNFEESLFPSARQLAIVVFSQLAVVFFRWNTFNPPSIGWFEVLAKQISETKPYNNYEIKFPPLGILIEGKLPFFLADVFNTNVYYAERYWHVLAWILFSISVYLLSTTYCGLKYSLVPACLGLTIYQLQPYKIVTGYLELAVTLWALGTYLLIISNRRSSNGLSRRLMVAGSRLVSRALRQMAISTEPAAPSKWPRLDFVELTATFFAWAPRTDLMAWVSQMSPWGVEVP